MNDMTRLEREEYRADLAAALVGVVGVGLIVYFLASWPPTVQAENPCVPARTVTVNGEDAGCTNDPQLSWGYYPRHRDD